MSRSHLRFRWSRIQRFRIRWIRDSSQMMLATLVTPGYAVVAVGCLLSLAEAYCCAQFACCGATHSTRSLPSLAGFGWFHQKLSGLPQSSNPPGRGAANPSDAPLLRPPFHESGCQSTAGTSKSTCFGLALATWAAVVAVTGVTGEGRRFVSTHCLGFSAMEIHWRWRPPLEIHPWQWRPPLMTAGVG